MSQQGDDLFSRPYYPGAPGWTSPTTSRQAATYMAPRAASLRERALNAIIQSPTGLTADEIAVKINCDRLAVRPRVTELRATARIADTGKTRKNESGRNAVVWIDIARRTA